MKNFFLLFLLFFTFDFCNAKPSFESKMQSICNEASDLASSWLVGVSGDKKYSITWFSLSEEDAVLCVTEKQAGIENMISKNTYKLRPGSRFVAGSCVMDSVPNSDVFVEGVPRGEGDVGSDVKIHKAWKFDVSKKELIEVDAKKVSCVIS